VHLVTEVLGNTSNRVLHEQIHRLEHHDAVETVTIPVTDLARRRLKLVTDKGSQVAIALPRSEKLCDGAILLLSAERAIVVRIEAEAWLRLTPRDAPAALAVGYLAGNLHWRVRFDGNDLLVAIDHGEPACRERLAALVEEGKVEIVGPVTMGDNRQ
jgi:urease accessory protein